jgi:dTDP-4-dehydrorhamnose reductase
MDNRKRVMTTGSNGLLGQKLTDIYRKLPEVEMLATAAGRDRYPAAGGYSFASMDIANWQEVEKVINDFRPDTIIHTAAMTNVDACETEKERCRLLNVEAMNWLTDSANRCGAHFISISTDFIFDGKNGPYDENAVAKPLSYYGWSKWAGEEIIRQKAAKWAILRTVLVYGLVADMSRSNIVLWAKEALEKRKTISVVDDQYRTPTLAEDLAMGCRLAELKEATGIFNISGKDFMSIYELVEQVARHYALSMDQVQRIKSDELNQAAVRPPRTGFKLDKAMTILGYKPHSFDEGISLLEQQLKDYESQKK